MAGFDLRKGVRDVEQLLIARRALYETVYYHKTVHCAEGMVALFLRRPRHVLRGTHLRDVTRIVEPLVEMVGGESLAPNSSRRWMISRSGS